MAQAQQAGLESESHSPALAGKGEEDNTNHPSLRERFDSSALCVRAMALIAAN
jgi:hypothetical protein